MALATKCPLCGRLAKVTRAGKFKEHRAPSHRLPDSTWAVMPRCAMSGESAKPTKKARS